MDIRGFLQDFLVAEFHRDIPQADALILIGSTRRGQLAAIRAERQSLYEARTREILSLLSGCIWGPNRLLNRLILLWILPFSIYLFYFVAVKPDHYWLPVMLPLYSAALNIPLGTVRSRIFRGRKLLREKLADYATERRLI